MQEIRVIIKAADSNIIMNLDEFIDENFLTAADRQKQVTGIQHTYYCSIGKSSTAQGKADEPEREPEPDKITSKFVIDAHPVIIAMLQEYVYREYAGKLSIHTYTDTDPDTATMIIKDRPKPILTAWQQEIIDYTLTHKIKETAEHYNISIGYIARLQKVVKKIKESEQP